MPRREGALTRDDVVDAAQSLADTHGVEAATLTAVAQKLGVRTPSLYNHVDGLDGMRSALRTRGLARLSEALREAAVGRAGRDALDGVCRAYLAFAERHPGLYVLTVRAPGEEDEIDAREHAKRILDTTLATLRAYELDGDDAVHAARFVRSALHGFATLGGADGFRLEQDLDATRTRLIAAIDAGLAAFKGPHGP